MENESTSKIIVGCTGTKLFTFAAPSIYTRLKVDGKDRGNFFNEFWSVRQDKKVIELAPGKHLIKAVSFFDYGTSYDVEFELKEGETKKFEIDLNLLKKIGNGIIIMVILIIEFFLGISIIKNIGHFGTVTLLLSGLFIMASSYLLAYLLRKNILTIKEIC